MGLVEGVGREEKGDETGIWTCVSMHQLPARNVYIVHCICVQLNSVFAKIFIATLYLLE